MLYITNTSRVHTLGKEIVNTIIHIHVPDNADIEVRKGMIKTVATQVGPSTQMVIASVSENLSASAAAKLQISSMERTVQYTRQKLEDIQSQPHYLN